MTTEVIVKANHGWPVRVSTVDPQTNEVKNVSIVPANETRSFYVFDSQDLKIHEVQPSEIETEVKVTD